MSRTIFLSLNEGEVVARCLAEKVGVSAIERLPGGGVRLVCMSSDGAERMRKKLHSKLLKDDVLRTSHRPSTPLW
jgi:hypothetical protein